MNVISLKKFLCLSNLDFISMSWRRFLCLLYTRKLGKVVWGKFCFKSIIVFDNIPVLGKNDLDLCMVFTVLDNERKFCGFKNFWWWCFFWCCKFLSLRIFCLFFVKAIYLTECLILLIFFLIECVRSLQDRSPVVLFLSLIFCRPMLKVCISRLEFGLHFP